MGPLQKFSLSELSIPPIHDVVCWCLLLCLLSAFRFHGRHLGLLAMAHARGAQSGWSFHFFTYGKLHATHSAPPAIQLIWWGTQLLGLSRESPDPSTFLQGGQGSSFPHSFPPNDTVAQSHFNPGLMGKVSTLHCFLLEQGCEDYSFLDQAVDDLDHGIHSVHRLYQHTSTGYILS